MMRSDRKPPLALRSPIRLRPRRPVQSSVNSLQTSSVSLAKSHIPKQSFNSEQHELRPEYQTISCELQELSKMVQDNLWGSTTKNQAANGHDESPLFQRGRFYDEYSARRNERLKRKRGESEIEKNTPCKQYLGVRIESAKRSTEVKKFESGRKMTTPLMERGQVATTTTATATRYSLRSSCKENKKPPLAMSFERSAMVEKKTAVRRTARKGY
ncbi:hypothetical protein L1987_32490 [Smallanthus sonchifolius]|uniref:Uncharacterized protein n=1 Tax=Smallanthus sonchifolius TaxID=185202 RepID=A0ACB9HND4_9ASTR|nr:hypothetical protein L1987_32490 [Smallanthus sonchifolius]